LGVQQPPDAEGGPLPPGMEVNILALCSVSHGRRVESETGEAASHTS
jgi:hypothetical protein